MSDPKKTDDKSNIPVEVDKNIINVDPGTLLAIVAAALLIPLLITGFLSH